LLGLTDTLQKKAQKCARQMDEVVPTGAVDPAMADDPHED
jgi:hypothetical protein